MGLQSDLMALSQQERHWLPLFGKAGKLAMRWAYRRNRDRVEAMEQAFNSFAATRQALLLQWSEEQWSLLESMALTLPPLAALEPVWLRERQALLADASELFVLAADGQLLASSRQEGGGWQSLSARGKGACCRDLTVMSGPGCWGPAVRLSTMR